MAITKVTEYFYASALTNSADVIALLADEDVDKAFECANEALRQRKLGGSESEIAEAMIAFAEVALACDDADQANEHAEGALDKAKKAGSAALEALALNVIAKVMDWWTPEAAISRAQSALDVAKASSSTHARACILHTLAEAMSARGRHPEAVVVGLDMVKLFKGLDPTGEACALMCTAQQQTQATDLQAAMESANQAAKMLVGDARREALAVKAAAVAALSSPDYAEEGLVLADDALSLLERSPGSDKSQIALKLDVANAKLRADLYIDAEDWAEHAQAQCKSIGSVHLEAEATHLLATVRLNIATADAKEMDDPDMSKATEASRDALQLYRKISNRKGEAAALLKLAQVRYRAGAVDMAKMAAEDAQSICRELGDTQNEASAILLIAYAMHKEDSLEAAKRNATKAFTLFQSVGDNENMENCTEFLDKVKAAQSERTRTDKATKKTVSDTGLVKLVNSVEDSTHLLSYFADMNEDEDTELGEFDLKEWGSSMNMLKIQA